MLARCLGHRYYNPMALTGVNLGGWLILERWMTPTLFEGTDAQDEYSFMQTPSAKAKLRNHQKTFITERDFKWLVISYLFLLLKQSVSESAWRNQTFGAACGHS